MTHAPSLSLSARFGRQVSRSGGASSASDTRTVSIARLTANVPLHAADQPSRAATPHCMNEILYSLLCVGCVVLMRVKGDLAEAQRCSEEAVRLRIEALGPDHPNTRTSVLARDASLACSRSVVWQCELHAPRVRSPLRWATTREPLTCSRVCLPPSKRYIHPDIELDLVADDGGDSVTIGISTRCWRSISAKRIFDRARSVRP
jgi:hypothetical protein